MTGTIKTKRPPVITVMGHIDHGKSTLLDYIRKSNVVDKEAGGITQHLRAYEITHKSKDGLEHKMTFLDTPGHEAFRSIRARGARVADIGVLVVSAEDGVKPQTVEAINVLKKDNIPFVVAINKIDKPGSDVERTKQNLAENDVFVEGFGGNVSWVAISAKTGEGVNELLDLLVLSSELLELTAIESVPAQGIIIESGLDQRKGITATAIIMNGTLKRGEYAVSGESFCSLKIVENFLGQNVEELTFSSPVRIIGWNKPPLVGDSFSCFKDKISAQNSIVLRNIAPIKDRKVEESEKTTIPIVAKADTSGGLDALTYEIGKFVNERIEPKVVLGGVGPINENDIRTASTKNALVIGFHTKIEPQAQNLALRLGVVTETSDIIYKLMEWVEGKLKERTPAIETQEVRGRAKILKFFSSTKDRQIIGGRVEEGAISVNESVKILRRDAEIGAGKIRDLQTQKQKTSTIEEGNEFGAMIESKIEIAPGDKIESYTIVRK